MQGGQIAKVGDGGWDVVVPGNRTLVEGEGDDPYSDLGPEQPLPSFAADADQARACRCDHPFIVGSLDGRPRCGKCGHHQQEVEV